jgi:hypothetical protein
MKVIFDIRCNLCGYTEEDEWAEPGQASYGSCPACTHGTMKQIIAPVQGKMVERVENQRGTTSNGTKWSVGSTVGKIKNGEFKK